MAIDIVALILVVSLAAWGWRKGALPQILQLAAVVLSFVAARPAGAVISVLLYDKTTVGQPFMDLGLTAAGGTIVFVVASIVGHFIQRGVRGEDEDPSSADRAGGAALAATKGAIIAWVAAAAVLSIEGALDKADPDNELYLRGGQTTELARQLPLPWEFAPLIEDKIKD